MLDQQDKRKLRWIQQKPADYCEPEVNRTLKDNYACFVNQDVSPCEGNSGKVITERERERDNDIKCPAEKFLHG